VQVIRRLRWLILILPVALLLVFTAYACGNSTFAAFKQIAKDLPVYTVKKGDSLYLIAMKYGSTVKAIKEVNGLTGDMIYPGQVFYIPENPNKLPADLKQPTGRDKPLKAILNEKKISIPIPDLWILIDKSDHLLSLYSGNILLKSYHAEFGDGGMGDKQVAGDHKTPEGEFYICQKSVLSPADKYLGSRWMRLSYPNAEDARRGLQQGLINRQIYQEIIRALNNMEIPPQRTALGGGVGIHGGDVEEFTDNWTWGCIGLTNKDVEEIYKYVEVGTKVIIKR